MDAVDQLVEEFDHEQEEDETEEAAGKRLHRVGLLYRDWDPISSLTGSQTSGKILSPLET